MLLSSLTDLDFFLYSILWGGLTYILFQTIEDPLKLKEIEKPKEREKTRNLYITNYGSLLHAIIMVFFSKKNIFFLYKSNKKAIICLVIYDWEYYRELKPLELTYMKVSLSYFIVDTVAGILKNYNDIWMSLHHFVMISAYFACLGT